MKTSNPFLKTMPRVTGLQINRQLQVKVGVLAVLITAGFFLVGMLIQGCRTQPISGDALSGVPAMFVNPTNAALAVKTTANTNASTSSMAVASLSGVKTAAGAPTKQAPNVTEKPAQSTQAPELIYRVKSGDTLFRIAKTHGTNIRVIKAANGLKSDRIFVGQELKIPRTALSVAEVAQP